MNADVTPDVQLSPVTPADIPDILRLQIECRLSPWSDRDYRTAINSPDFIVLGARSSKIFLGFIAARLITNSQFCELLNIAVSPPNQKKLIGETLIHQLFTLIAGKAHRILLEVREGNQPAINFYSKQGFYPSGVRKNYYSDPVENALLMEKMLNKVSLLRTEN